MKKVLILIVLAFFASNLNAQWEFCNIGYYSNAITISDSNIFVGTYGQSVQCSTNNGGEWKKKNVGIYNDSIMSLASSGNRIIAGTREGSVYYSSNSGVNWVRTKFQTSSTEYKFITSLAINENTIYVGSFGTGNSSALYISSNNGADWVERNFNFADRMISAIFYKGNDIFVSVSGKGIYFSSDNGANWIEKNYGMTQKSVNEIVEIGGYMFTGNQGGGVFVSSDYGENWIQKNKGLVNQTDFFVYAMTQSYGNLFIGTQSGIFMSSDFSENWIKKNTGMTNYPTYSLASNKDYIFAATAVGVYRAKLSDLGVNAVEESKTVDISISPNPATDYIEVNSPSIKRGIGSVSEIAIYNMLGECVLRVEQAPSPVQRIDVSGLTEGIYIIRIGNETRKFVKI
jgi:hypothetical protein